MPPIAKTFFLISVLALAMPVSALANYSGPKKGFDAVYDMTVGDTTLEYRVLSDGKGHLRTEIKHPKTHKTTATITDYVKGMTYDLIPKEKLVTAAPMEATEKNPVVDEESAKLNHATALGDKKIDGHICHGWSLQDGDTKREVWVGKDTGWYVQTIAESKGAKTDMLLRSFADDVPDAALFVVPASYTVKELKSNSR